MLGGFSGELPKKISGEKIVFAAQQLYTKNYISMFCGLGGEERTKFRKKKKEKKRKNFIAAKSELVGMKGYLKTRWEFASKPSERPTHS